MDAQQSAIWLLESVWRQRAFPVDPVWVAGKLGIDVIETILPHDVSGALIKDKDKDPIIVLCKTDSTNRKRFTCAHEIGHYAYRVTNDGDHYEYIDLRGNLSGAGSNSEEIYANQFAAEFLMPRSEISSLAKTERPAFLLARDFGVSDDAMRYRLKNLGLKIG